MPDVKKVAIKIWVLKDLSAERLEREVGMKSIVAFVVLTGIVTSGKFVYASESEVCKAIQDMQVCYVEEKVSENNVLLKNILVNGKKRFTTGSDQLLCEYFYELDVDKILDTRKNRRFIFPRFNRETSINLLSPDKVDIDKIHFASDKNKVIKQKLIHSLSCKGQGRVARYNHLVKVTRLADKIVKEAIQNIEKINSQNYDLDETLYTKDLLNSLRQSFVYADDSSSEYNEDGDNTVAYVKTVPGAEDVIFVTPAFYKSPLLVSASFLIHEAFHLVSGTLSSQHREEMAVRVTKLIFDHSITSQGLIPKQYGGELNSEGAFCGDAINYTRPIRPFDKSTYFRSNHWIGGRQICESDVSVFDLDPIFH